MQRREGLPPRARGVLDKVGFFMNLSPDLAQPLWLVGRDTTAYSCSSQDGVGGGPRGPAFRMLLPS